jgi:hypothetical protein
MVAVPIVGAPGTLAVVILLEAALEGPVPAPFTAVTEKVKVVLVDRPVILIGDVALEPVNPPVEDVAM